MHAPATYRCVHGPTRGTELLLALKIEQRSTVDPAMLD
jgi:hypothetical protein